MNNIPSSHRDTTDPVVFPTLHLGTTEVTLLRDQHQQDFVHVHDIEKGAAMTIELLGEPEQAFAEVSKLGEGDVEDVRRVLGNLIQSKYLPW